MLLCIDEISVVAPVSAVSSGRSVFVSLQALRQMLNNSASAKREVSLAEKALDVLVSKLFKVITLLKFCYINDASDDVLAKAVIIVAMIGVN
jgi:hypothetical protein